MGFTNWNRKGASWTTDIDLKMALSGNTSLALPQVESITGLVYIIKRAAGIYRKSSPVKNLFLYAEGDIVF